VALFLGYCLFVECYAGEEADADEEPGLMTVTWCADVTNSSSNLRQFFVQARKHRPASPICLVYGDDEASWSTASLLAESLRPSAGFRNLLFGIVLTVFVSVFGHSIKSFCRQPFVQHGIITSMGNRLSSGTEVTHAAEILQSPRTEDEAKNSAITVGEMHAGGRIVYH